MKVLIEVSARHVHLSQKDLEKLFGKGFLYKKLKDLSQTGEFATKHTVDLAGPKGKLLKVRVLGPIRSHTQIELAKTDAYKLGITPPVLESGHLRGSVGCEIKGPKGKIKLKSGVILAERHFHCDPKTAEKLGIKNNQFVKMKILGPRALVFDKVVVRVAPNFNPTVHLDTDEGNAAGIEGTAMGELII